MKTIFYLFLLFSISASASDTISVWHIFYNKSKIKEFHQYNKERKIILKLGEIKSTDSLTIKYFNDYDRQEYKISFSVELNDSVVINSDMNKENSFTFSVVELVEYMRKEKKSRFKVFRNNWNYRPTETELLFEIQLE